MKTVIVLLLAFSVMQLRAQGVTGRIMDNNIVPLENAILQVYKRGVLVAGSMQDLSGGFRARLSEPGVYEVLFFCPGYDSLRLTGVVVLPARLTSLWVHLSPSGVNARCLSEEYPRERWLQDQQDMRPFSSRSSYSPFHHPADKNTVDQPVKGAGMNYPGNYTLTREEIDQMPAGAVGDLISIFPGTYQARRGDGVSVYGSRINGTSYYADGVGR